MLFGVAGGMARWLGLDPSIVRIVWALLILAAGVGLLLYIVAAFVIPEEPEGWAPGIGESPTGASTLGRDVGRPTRNNAPVVFGIVLVVVGAWLLLERYLPAFDRGVVLPGLLVVVGVVFVLGALVRGGGR
jgi:phage shock protein C